ncbi:hypothetical protein IFR05_000554 [Cadophora sp. M221]|nr:hypothetical protein IFR05_000554 [Cadophora sp. M221]
MVKFTTAASLLASVSYVTAWPQVIEMNEKLQFAKRAEPPYRTPAFPDQGRPNTGLPPLGFNAQDQLVDVADDGPHAFKAPVAGAKRGQCPGLNAAANHGYLNRNGITTITQATTGLGQAYNMAPDLAAFLAVVAVALGGDPLTQSWSIGNGFTPAVPLFPANGIAGTHNKYEGDASIIRGDAYLNGGNVGIFQMRSWEHLYSLGETFGFNEVAAQSDYVTRWSVMNNPYYFSAPFAGLVAPAAHNLVINLMSNHSAEVPGGTLTRETLMSFFAVTGTPDNFVHNRGMERIPYNWYRRPTASAHTIPEVLVDLFGNNAQYPGILRFGGNTGTVNSFAGVDLGNLTNGAFNLDTLAEGNNAACFLLQASLAGLPDAASPLLGTLGTVLKWATAQLGPISSKLGCPQLATFNNALFNGLPGASYAGTGQ